MGRSYFEDMVNRAKHTCPQQWGGRAVRCKVAVQLKGLMSMALDFDMKLKGTLRCDANAAIGIIHREGLGGRPRHIKVQYLWIQAAVKDKELDIRKVPGTSNPADMFTKAVNEDLISK